MQRRSTRIRMRLRQQHHQASVVLQRVRSIVIDATQAQAEGIRRHTHRPIQRLRLRRQVRGGRGFHQLRRHEGGGRPRRRYEGGARARVRQGDRRELPFQEQPGGGTRPRGDVTKGDQDGGRGRRRRRCENAIPPGQEGQGRHRHRHGRGPRVGQPRPTPGRERRHARLGRSQGRHRLRGGGGRDRTRRRARDQGTLLPPSRIGLRLHRAEFHQRRHAADSTRVEGLQ
mmetsp:Transcript_29753/g.54656  ORF Transcript_29753/g.54656 Transcript_29753/m.54656 type:complete len:228 (+) Transcript_29753:254-937(+)